MKNKNEEIHRTTAIEKNAEEIHRTTCNDKTFYGSKVSEIDAVLDSHVKEIALEDLKARLLMRQITVEQAKIELKKINQ